MKLKASHKLGMLFVLLSCPAISAIAQPFPDPCYFGGWSAGVGLGVTTFMSNTTQDTFAPTQTSHASGQIYKYGPMGNIYVGYAGVWDNLYLGAELGLNFLGANETVLHGSSQTANLVTALPDDEIGVSATIQNSVEAYTKVRRNTVEPMLDIKPGILLAPNSLLYARLGLSWNDIDIKTSTRYRTNGFVAVDEVETIGTGASSSTPLSESHSKTVTGFRLGFGLEYMISPNLGVGSDYVYTWYDNVSTGRRITDASAVVCSEVDCTVSTNGVLRNDAKAKVSDQEVLLQLIYHFNC